MLVAAAAVEPAKVVVVDHAIRGAVLSGFPSIGVASRRDAGEYRDVPSESERYLLVVTDRALAAQCKRAGRARLHVEPVLRLGRGVRWEVAQDASNLARESDGDGVLMANAQAFQLTFVSARISEHTFSGEESPWCSSTSMGCGARGPG